MSARRFSLIIGSALVAFGPAYVQGEEARAIMRIGMIQTLFRGSDSTVMVAQTEPMGRLLATQTGLDGKISVVTDAAEMARRIDNGDLQLGIVHGIEYAWIMKQYPELQPLVVAYNQTTRLKAYLLVRGDSSFQSLADLKGERLALPRRSMNHCHLFLHKAIVDAGQGPEGFFAPCTPAASVETAIESVVEGKSAVTAIDGVAWELYRERKPGRAARLRVIQESGLFPTATIIHKPGACDAAVVKQFRDGLTTAHERLLGRQMLTLWRLSQFSEVPEDYRQLLADVLKVFPRPVEPACFAAERPAEREPRTVTSVP